MFMVQKGSSGTVKYKPCILYSTIEILKPGVGNKRRVTLIILCPWEGWVKNSQALMQPYLT